MGESRLILRLGSREGEARDIRVREKGEDNTDFFLSMLDTGCDLDLSCKCFVL